MKKSLLSIAAGIIMAASPLSAATALPSEKDMKAYLLVFFSDADHSVHFAVSHDGYSFTALNDNRPVIAGDSL